MWPAILKTDAPPRPNSIRTERNTAAIRPGTAVGSAWSILGHLAGPTPDGFLQLVQHDGYTLFFYALHGPFEWLLMPWALMVNWDDPRRRRLLVVTAAIFYAGRVTSALYFAPAALDWGAHPADAAAEIDQVALWVHLDLVRVAVQDAVIAALLLPAALHHTFSRNGAPSRGRAMD